MCASLGHILKAGEDMDKRSLKDSGNTQKAWRKGYKQCTFQLDICDTGDHNSDGKGTGLYTPPSSHHLSLFILFVFSLKQISKITYYIFCLFPTGFP